MANDPNQPDSADSPNDAQEMSPMMQVARNYGDLFISRTIALTLAEMVMREQAGDAAVDRRLPLVIEDEGSAWKITAMHPPSKEFNIGKELLENGPLIMRIAKFDGRILDYGRYSEFLRAPDWPSGP